MHGRGRRRLLLGHVVAMVSRKAEDLQSTRLIYLASFAARYRYCSVNINMEEKE